MRRFFNKKTIFAAAACFIVIAGAVATFVVWRTKNRIQVEFNIHINKEAIYLSIYSEPPQFAIWLENPETGECKQVFVTYRVSRGDWEGKADVPSALPRWKAVFRDGDLASERSDEEIAVSGATPRNDYFRVRAEVRPESEWICWIEMNLAGDFNDYYPQFNLVTKEEDEFACGQPSILYRTEIKAKEGLEYSPVASLISLWDDGKNTLAPVDNTITTATNVFDTISIAIVRPKPIIINKNTIDNQDILK